MPDRTCLKSIPWETRNLGLQSFAVDDEFFGNPDDELLKESLRSAEAQNGKIFAQARVAKNDFAALPVLQRYGFYFAETTLIPFSVFRKNDALSRFMADKSSFAPARYSLDGLGLTIMDRRDLAQCATVKAIAAESFSDDRIHLDANCPKEIADRRFCYWVDDLLADEAVVFYLLEHLGACTGFMARKGEDLILAGFAQRYIKSGLGDFLWLSVLEDMHKQGIAQTHTCISANNTPVLNLYVRLGFKFKDPSVTLHYWTLERMAEKESAR